jgi:hypothetical protein
MKNALAVIAITLALIGSSFSTTTKTRTSEPISGYMRRVGLLYVENLDELTYDCAKNDDCEGHWQSSMDAIQNRIEITISESKRPPGDAVYFILLKNARRAVDTFKTGNFNSANHPAWGIAASVCVGSAKSMAVDTGVYEYSDSKNCEDAIESAMNIPVVPSQNVQDAATAKLCKRGVFEKAYCDDYRVKHSLSQRYWDCLIWAVDNDPAGRVCKP